ncbi:uncharacterized protein LOC120437418 [Oreochromis aureus]|uniref:uncharacterized protein LOC120437418 n=1 Tax=Oreochromis aureus TaxID=47969 RepID=UPI0019534B39|nr:uncharacterized protein LOC120437418 [Oreochromis aureus]
MQTVVTHLPQMAFLRVLLILSLVSAYTGLKKINVKPAKNIRLDCQGPKNATITLLEWKRHDLLSDGYVFFYRDGRLHKTFQHPIFKDRVELSDPQMKNGNMSIILYNTTVNDTGTYECRMIMGNTWHRGRGTSEIKHRIRLKVRTKARKNITAESGHNVSLTCQAPNNNFKALEWSRAELRDENVLLYWDGNFESFNQHPSFKGRVDLQMKDGDVSLILKNVKINDTGTYECRVIRKRPNHGRTSHLKTKPICIIYLSVVDPPGQTGGHTEDGGKEDGIRKYLGLEAVMSVFSIVMTVITIIMIEKNKKQEGGQTQHE